MINRVTPFQIQSGQPLPQTTNSNPIKETKTNFSEILKQSINEVNTAQNESDKMAEALASGKNVELHDVMISAEKASVMMVTAIEVRNKAIEAYQEMMRMQV